MTKTVCKTKLGKNEWQTAIEVTRLYNYWGITEQKKKKEKKYLSLRLQKKIKYITKAQKMKRKVTIIFFVFITKKF